jgi:hypothetical protein
MKKYDKCLVIRYCSMISRSTLPHYGLSNLCEATGTKHNHSSKSLKCLYHQKGGHTKVCMLSYTKQMLCDQKYMESKQIDEKHKPEPTNLNLFRNIEQN